MNYCGKVLLQVQRKSNGDIRVLGNCPMKVQVILQEAFPTYTFNSFQPQFGRYDWGIFVQTQEEGAFVAIEQFCKLLCRVVFMDDELDECFALDYHMHWAGRTAMGTLINSSKPYHQSVTDVHRSKCKELARYYAEFITVHPAYRQASYLVAVPLSQPDKEFDLPMQLAREIGILTGHEVAEDEITKIKKTPPIKDIQDASTKQEVMSGAFACTSNRFQAKSILIIDDIYKSGTTINEVARTIRQAGAAKVLGLVATKTQKG